MSAPGFYSDMAADVYHADPAPEPSLSSSIAKTLISRSPAHAYAKHPKLGGTYEPDTSRKMDVGSCAHALLLGRGAKIHVIDAKSYQTNAAKAERDDARERGEIPVLLADYELASDMVSAARGALDAAGEIAAFADAQAELVAIAEDRGMWMRAMVDRFDEKNLVIWDYKTTTASAAPEAVGRLIESMGYDVSAAHYQHVFGVIRPEWRGRMTFRWLIQEAEPPYEATICTLDGTGREIGARKAAFARGLWRDCMTSGVWPGYPRGLVTASYPAWAESRWLERESAAFEAGRDPLRHEAPPAPSAGFDLLPPC